MLKKSVLFFTMFVLSSHGRKVTWNKTEQREKDITLISEIINLITDPCALDPCQNDGICIATENEFKCICNLPYSGKTCSDGNNIKSEILMTTSNHSVLITNNTYQNLTITTGSYEAISSDSYIMASDENVTSKGNNSTIDIIMPALKNKSHDVSTKETCETDNDCLNGGTCRSKGNKLSCQCTPNFGGATCEVNLLCVPIDQSCRLINAVCVVIDDHALCECPNGTLYHRRSGLCEDICDSRKCFNGKCEIIGKTYRCNCDQGYTGSHCDEKEKGKNENFVPWFTVIASINLLICVLLIAMFSVLCQIRTFIKSS